MNATVVPFSTRRYLSELERTQREADAARHTQRSAESEWRAAPKKSAPFRFVPKTRIEAFVDAFRSEFGSTWLLWMLVFALWVGAGAGAWILFGAASLGWLK